MGVYSQKLIEEVKRLYPSNMDMQRMAEGGTYFLGRCLDDSSSGGIGLDAILTATSLAELQCRAKALKEKVDLYRLWLEETKKW